MCLLMHATRDVLDSCFDRDLTCKYFAYYRDRGVTMLLRVDVSTSSAGALLITLSDHASGFAPYRLDNCTPLTLHLR